MIVKSVTFDVKPEYIDKFIEATLENQKGSLEEKGVISFDFLQSADETGKFLLYEVYESEEAMEGHLKTEHFNKWINTVEEYFFSPREKTIFIPIK
ncbi:putative quinol monooxygenase [Clostridium manihotivorum]|uniref:Antibiotic biosynthesis monooxygenase n=1 Tax=Clostridium manihotivorum TaxID=2320868 RepID=A0A410DZG8_9CLOT|nr:putative quinol monooxygenase [Clostridium manihotivorum]QAA34486.1 antibiotic biosynthesis monooxygenase [Clostridium manihotivorum]